MKANIKGLHKSIIGANQDYMRDVLNMSKLIAWWKDETNTSLNRKEVLNLSARFFSLSLLTPQFIVENCGQSNEFICIYDESNKMVDCYPNDGRKKALMAGQSQQIKKFICGYEMQVINGEKKRVLSKTNILTRFSPSLVGNAIKNYVYKQMAIVSSQQPVEKKETEKTDLISEQEKEVEKLQKRVNANKRQTAANAAQKKVA